MSKYYTLCWQVFFEDNLLNKNLDQIYNCHFQIKKISSKGKAQDRFLVLSNKVKFLIQFIFNITLQSKQDEIKIDEYKWSDSIKSVLKVVINPENRCEMKVFYSEKINKEENKKEKMTKIKSKSEREFIFTNKKYSEQFVFLLRSNYFKLTESYLPVEKDKEKK